MDFEDVLKDITLEIFEDPAPAPAGRTGVSFFCSQKCVRHTMTVVALSLSTVLISFSLALVHHWSLKLGMIWWVPISNMSRNPGIVQKGRYFSSANARVPARVLMMIEMSKD